MILSDSNYAKAVEFAQVYVLGTFIDCCNVDMREEGFTWEKDFKDRVLFLIETTMPLRYQRSKKIMDAMIKVATLEAGYHIQDLLGVIKGTKDGDIVSSYNRYKKE